MILYTEVIDDGASLKIRIGAEYTSVQKDQVALKISESEPDIVIINDLTGGSYYARYQDVNPPATGSAEALRAAIEAMLDNVPGGSGATEATLAALSAKITNPLPVSLPTGAQAITSTSVAVSGSVTAGARSVGFLTSSDFSGTINGADRFASTFYGFEAETGKTLPAIAYVITTGSIIIDKIV